jgi:hypothetical protein
MSQPALEQSVSSSTRRIPQAPKPKDKARRIKCRKALHGKSGSDRHDRNTVLERVIGFTEWSFDEPITEEWPPLHLHHDPHGLYEEQAYGVPPTRLEEEEEKEEVDPEQDDYPHKERQPCVAQCLADEISRVLRTHHEHPSDTYDQDPDDEVQADWIDGFQFRSHPI